MREVVQKEEWATILFGAAGAFRGKKGQGSERKKGREKK